MATKKTAASHSPDVRERAVRLVLEGGGEHPTQRPAINSVSAKIGCMVQTRRKWARAVQRDDGQRDGGQRPGPARAGRERLRALEREVRELRPANETLRQARAYLAMAELDRRLRT